MSDVTALPEWWKDGHTSGIIDRVRGKFEFQLAWAITDYIVSEAIRLYKECDGKSVNMPDEVKLPEWWTDEKTSRVSEIWHTTCNDGQCEDTRAAIAEVLRIEAEHRNENFDPVAENLKDLRHHVEALHHKAGNIDERLLKIEAEHRKTEPPPDDLSDKLAGLALDVAMLKSVAQPDSDVWKSITRTREDLVAVINQYGEKSSQMVIRLEEAISHVQSLELVMQQHGQRLADLEHVAVRVETHGNTIMELLERVDRLETKAKVPA